jgi:hypothetical protein
MSGTKNHTPETKWWQDEIRREKEADENKIYASQGEVEEPVNYEGALEKIDKGKQPATEETTAPESERSKELPYAAAEDDGKRGYEQTNYKNQVLDKKGKGKGKK